MPGSERPDRSCGILAQTSQDMLDNARILAVWLWEGVLHKPVLVELNDAGQC